MGRCHEPGCGRLLKSDETERCSRCRRHQLRAIEVGDELRSLPDRVLYNVLAALPGERLVELRAALRCSHLPAGRIA